MSRNRARRGTHPVHNDDVNEHAVHLRGAEVLEYGDLQVVTSGGIAAAMSVGADRNSPSLRFKGDIANEDALSGRDNGRFARLVVADAHFGDQASAILVESLHDAPLRQRQPDLHQAEDAIDGSATTLTSLWLDRKGGQAHTSWFGDSLAFRLRVGDEPEPLVDPDDYFVAPDRFDWSDCMTASFDVVPGDLLVSFTDGVNECVYREPARSINPQHLQSIFESTTEPGCPSRFVRTLGELALAGVDGNPGGQDNIAIVALYV